MFVHIFQLDYYGDVLLQVQTKVVNSAGPCDNRPGVIGRRLSVAGSGGVPPVATASQFTPGAVDFVQPFCIALTTTIPDSTETVVLSRSAITSDPTVVISLSQASIRLELGGIQIDFSSNILTTSTSDFVHVQVCVDGTTATLYLNCVPIDTATVGPIQASSDDAYVFFQRSIFNDTDAFLVSFKLYIITRKFVCFGFCFISCFVTVLPIV